MLNMLILLTSIAWFLIGVEESISFDTKIKCLFFVIIAMLPLVLLTPWFIIPAISLLVGYGIRKLL